MPGELTTVGANYALDIVTGRAAGPGARTTYVALLTATPTDATTIAALAEISAAGYARQSCAWTAPSGDPSRTQNSAVITFGPFTADPPNVVAAALVSSASGTTGDHLMFWTLDVAKDAAINESIQFAAGALYMTLD